MPAGVPPSEASSRARWTFAISAAALFMFSLDRLIVTTALPAIRRDLGASLGAAEWTVSAYTLTFAVLLLTGAALGDHFGRRRLFVIGVAIFTTGSLAAAVAPSVGALVAARALQGAGGAILAPLSLTILSAAVPARRRGAALGAWGAVAGLAATLGPVLGGVLTEARSWHWIFWLNVPVGVALIPLARLRLDESYGPHDRLDVPGVALAGGALLALAWGLVRAQSAGWTSPPILLALGAGALGLAAFVAWERRAPAPMLPPRFFASRTFAAANAASLLAYSGLLGALFVIAQLLQIGLGYSPTGAGLRLLPWTVATMLAVPAAGALCDRLGARSLMVGALALEASGLGWLAAVAAPGVPYGSLVGPLVLVGLGSGAFFAPISHAVLGAVRPVEQGQASGASVAIRELGGVLGVAVLASILAAHGGGATPGPFIASATPALWVGAAAVALGAVAALALPRAARVSATPVPNPGGRPSDRAGARRDAADPVAN
jgi:EmrB/QacA subfamily drug resistance transporter